MSDSKCIIAKEEVGSGYVIDKQEDQIRLIKVLKKGKKKRVIYEYVMEYLYQIQTTEEFIEYLMNMVRFYNLKEVQIKKSVLPVLTDKCKKQEEYNIGDIILVKPINDIIDIHLYLITEKQNKDNYTGFLITSNLNKDRGKNYRLKITRQNNQRKEGVVITTSKAQIPLSYIIGLFGKYTGE